MHVVQTLYVRGEEAMFTRDEFVQKFDAMYPNYEVLSDELARSRVVHSFHKTYGYQFFRSKRKEEGGHRHRHRRAIRSHSETLDGSSSNAQLLVAECYKPWQLASQLSVTNSAAI